MVMKRTTQVDCFSIDRKGSPGSRDRKESLIVKEKAGGVDYRYFNS